MFDEHKHLALFNCFEVDSLTAANDLSNLRPINMEQVIDSLSDPREALYLFKIWTFYLGNNHYFFLQC